MGTALFLEDWVHGRDLLRDKEYQKEPTRWYIDASQHISVGTPGQTNLHGHSEGCQKD